MFIPDSKTILVSSASAAPPKALSFINRKILDNLGGRVADFFPNFGMSFPLAMREMELTWSRPKLAVRDMGKDWLVTLYLERENCNLFFNNPFPFYADILNFETDVFGMLPREWMGLYGVMESFLITTNSNYSPVGWRNTLMPRGIGVELFCSETGVKKAHLKEFAKKIKISKLESLTCWLLTNNNDSLWLDEQRCDRVVYYIPSGRFGDVYVLPRSSVIDEYLAHLIRSGSPRDFNFKTFID